MRAQTGHLGGRVGDDQPDEVVDVRLAFAVIVRVLLARQRDARVEFVEDERPAADGAAGDVAVLVDDFFGQDPEDRAADLRLERCVRVLEHELDSPRVRRRHAGDLIEGRFLGRDLHEVVERPGHVLGGHRPAVHRRQVLPLRVGPQGEGPRLAVLARFPRFGEVAFHDVGLGRHARALLGHEQPAVEKRRELLDTETDVEVRVAAGRVVGPDRELECPAVFRRGTRRLGSVRLRSRRLGAVRLRGRRRRRGGSRRCAAAGWLVAPGALVAAAPAAGAAVAAGAPALARWCRPRPARRQQRRADAHNTPADQQPASGPAHLDVS